MTAVTDKIITSNVFPPIPDRRFDWCAYHDGQEENTSRYGWGATEVEALADLKRMDDEYLECELGICARCGEKLADIEDCEQCAS